MSSRRIFVAGHQGMVGRALCRQLQKADSELITASRSELDLTEQAAVVAFFRRHKIDEVYLAAAKVGGIYANDRHPADFIYQNLMIQTNVIHAAHLADVQKLLFLGSSCIYPKFAPQPIAEAALLTGLLEPTNEPYAIAKIAGIKLCESYNRQYQRDYRSAMPTNLYGPYDNFDPLHGHVIPALITRFHQAITQQTPIINIWGSGLARREFMHVDDLASALTYLMAIPTMEYWAQLESRCSHINVGTGIDCSIRELAEMLAQLTGYTGTLDYDTTQPEGTPVKKLNVTKLHAFGWQASTSLADGLRQTVAWYQAHYL